MARPRDLANVGPTPRSAARAAIVKARTSSAASCCSTAWLPSSPR